MMFPLGLWDVSLLTAITAIILLITLNMLSPYHGKVNILSTENDSNTQQWPSHSYFSQR